MASATALTAILATHVLAMAAVPLARCVLARLQAAKETVTFAANSACQRELALQVEVEEETEEAAAAAAVVVAAMEAALPDMWPAMMNVCPVAASVAIMATTAMLDKHVQLISNAGSALEAAAAAAAAVLVVTAVTANLHPPATPSRATGLVVLRVLKPATASRQTPSQLLLPPSQTPLADPAATTTPPTPSLPPALVIASPALPITARPSLLMLALLSLLT